MLSMTGYGRGEYKQGGVELTVEIKTVNNRYLDVNIKSPRIFIGYEETLRSRMREKLSRGHADVYISFTDKRDKAKQLYLDQATAFAYVTAAKNLNKLFPSLPNDFTVTALMRCPDVLKNEDVGVADEELVSALNQAMDKALENLNAMRAVEGKKLEEDMLSRLQNIEQTVEKIATRAPLVAADYRARLTEKVKNYLEGVTVDEGRLLTEVAVFTDKSNIDEELTRLRSHIAQFKQICLNERVGRQLDFLVQEFNRESNTVCSKSNDIEITRCGLALKNEIEKIREQVQNVE